ncbi:MAG: DUF2589 domain-containing protein, partial [Calditrichaeota bacterium]|nr:DUF2589 domain-containing protein [Calditrichota bacterium]
IQIKECDINFSVELVGLEQKAKIKDGISSIEQLKSLNVRLSNESKDGDGNSATNSITVNLHFYEPDLPAGWITMLNLLKNSMTLKDTN